MEEPVEPPAEPRRCPRCDAPLAPEQDWCLECGTAVTTRIVRPPGWRLPLLVGLAVLAALGVGVAIAVSAISDDADRAAGPAGTRAAATSGPRTTIPPATRSAPARTGTVHTVTVPGAKEATGGGAVPLWPARQQGYTVVVPTTGGRPGAEREARRLIAARQRTGILKTDGYDFFTPGGWVVWVGRYPDRPGAQAHLAAVKAKAPSAYVTLVRPRGG